ncbi:alcohol oxidase [Clavulina sp. PMI_390]|nr:alcohol oxidase [Clavulina sp. PMI_390]
MRSTSVSAVTAALLAASFANAAPATSTTTTYDYIIVGKSLSRIHCQKLANDSPHSCYASLIGGGLGGLTVANRLSASGSKQVLVLEAGTPNLNDPAILIPGYAGGVVGNPTYDWNFETVAQPNADNRQIAWNRGKGLGGSTGINFMAYGSWELTFCALLVALAALGNTGWDWDSLFSYMKKAEDFTAPYAPYAAQNNLTYVAANHGTSGPIKTSLTSFVSPAQYPWEDAFIKNGFPVNKDADGGANTGVWYSFNNIDNSTKTRSYAANAYYQPVASRSNLHVVTSAWASKILTTTSKGSVQATGVQYYVNGTQSTATLKSGGEVISSAGAINSPKLLELSGIGNSTILKSLGIPVVLDLPYVGENMIDQVFTGVSYELKNSSIITFDSLRDTTFAAQALAHQATKTGVLTLGVSAFALAPLQWITNQAASMIASQIIAVAKASVPTRIKALWGVQLAQLALPSKFGLIEIVGFPGFFTSKSAPATGKKYLTFTADLQLPFSRGNIHITSTDYTVQPAINPNYFSQNFDLVALRETVKFIRKIASTGGFVNVLGAEADPGADVNTDAEIEDYITGFAGTEYHTVGSCAMLPQSLGGVVSPELIVYGTSNIRVVDMSVLPLQITAHPSSFLYGVCVYDSVVELHGHFTD